eukprot:TRINITY_DN13248_c0_g1_i1.p1 TRINITY_DN13248_c0_g1~~TRINITY_DN13248_c0_g1_i1.p1  ORF type:complete len:760 (-),score=153.33 TRINITY_DN13248_c0_g1_i1:242-2521(-)
MSTTSNRSAPRMKSFADKPTTVRRTNTLSSIPSSSSPATPTSGSASLTAEGATPMGRTQANEIDSSEGLPSIHRHGSFSASSSARVDELPSILSATNTTMTPNQLMPPPSAPLAGPSSSAAGASSSSSHARSGEKTVTSLRSSKFIILSESTVLYECCRAMADNRVDAVLLTKDADEKSLTGILTDKDVAKAIANGVDPQIAIAAQVMTKEVTCASPDTLVSEALRMMVTGHFRHLPVVRAGTIFGLIDITKCMYDAIAKLERITKSSATLCNRIEQELISHRATGMSSAQDLVATLKEKMFPTIATIIGESNALPEVSAQSNVRDAVKKMIQFKGSAVLVVEDRKAVGIFTSKDLVTRVLAAKLTPSTLVQKVMTQNPDCVHQKTTILEALQQMQDGRFLHLPVIGEDERVCGLVDVLQLTYHVVSNTESGAAAQSSWQNLWGSVLCADEDDRQSRGASRRRDDDTVSNFSDAFTDDTRSVNTRDPDVFVYKYSDFSGNVHRLTSSAVSYTTLLQSICIRLNESSTATLTLKYRDEDGELVLLSQDDDLRDAVSFARASGQRALKLYVSHGAIGTAPRRLPSHNMVNANDGDPQSLSRRDSDASSTHLSSRGHSDSLSYASATAIANLQSKVAYMNQGDLVSERRTPETSQAPISVPNANANSNFNSNSNSNSNSNTESNARVSSPTSAPIADAPVSSSHVGASTSAVSADSASTSTATGSEKKARSKKSSADVIMPIVTLALGAAGAAAFLMLRNKN